MLGFAEEHSEYSLTETNTEKQPNNQFILTIHNIIATYSFDSCLISAVLKGTIPALRSFGASLNPMVEGRGGWRVDLP